MKTAALLTDLYQLTMLQSYYEHGMEDKAVFEFFVRRMPPHRNFLLFAGLEQVIQYLEELRFSEEELDWLAGSGRFNAGLVDRLAEFRFSGEVHAMAEGTVFFPEEPVLRVTAPLPEAQLVESRIINILNYQILVASKAARCRLIAPGKTLIDFGMRRAHAGEAALFASRADYIAGFDGTATVQAGQEFDIPIYGTMAHSYIQAHESESQAFENFANCHPNNTVLLIDTFDTRRGAEKVVHLAQTMKEKGVSIKAVRLDSGDLLELAPSVRQILDEGGCGDIGIFASGDLDEYRLAELIDGGCPVDAFGIGTRVDVSQDSPSLDCAYKLQEYSGLARRKRSEGKMTWPGAKQVYRYPADNGYIECDLVALDAESPGAGRALVGPVMHEGCRARAAETLEHIRERSKQEFASLPQHLRGLDVSKNPYTVNISSGLQELAAEVDRTFD
ncbi:MAG: nicotinate phosphoribosyltransferase [Woeseia sp.]